MLERGTDERLVLDLESEGMYTMVRGRRKKEDSLQSHLLPLTIAQLKETILGKVLIELGMFGDGTSFGDLDVKTIINELQRVGYESYGNEVLYDGLTGQQIETSIFIGPVYYQRLKHMVNDKQHSRSIGPTTKCLLHYQAYNK